MMTAPEQLAALDPRACRAWPWLPHRAAIGTWVLGPTGERLRVVAGSAKGLACDPWPPDGHRSIAGDPCASSRRP